MCESCLPADAQRDVSAGSPMPNELSRRQFLIHSAAVAVAASSIGGVSGGLRVRQSDVRTVDIGGGVTILGRDAWGADRPPTRAMTAERPEDVKFLLVHHTVSSNTYGSDGVAGMIRGFHSFHTGAEKRWADVAYNFLIDRFGRVWEARAGSIDRPMKGAATGGSQGHALLCSFIGDHTSEAPSPEAQNAMTHLLAWLADTYAISTAPGATATFVSRGSNRHPEGTTVETPTIQGHRGMSLTSCPGDACYALVENDFPARVEQIRSNRAQATTTSIEASTTTTTTAASTTTTTTAASTTTTTVPTTASSSEATVSTSTTTSETVEAAPASTSTSISVASSDTVPTSEGTTSTGVRGEAGEEEVAAAPDQGIDGDNRIGTFGAIGGTVVVVGAVAGAVIARRRQLAAEAVSEAAPPPG